MVDHLKSGVADGGEVVLHSAHRRIISLEGLFDVGRWVFPAPDGVREDQISTWLQQTMTDRQRGWEPEVVERAFGPDEVVGRRRLLQPAHIAHPGLDTWRKSAFGDGSLEPLDGGRMAIDGEDRARGEVCKVECLRAGPAAEVEDGWGGRQLAAQAKRLLRGSAIARALAWEGFEDLKEELPEAWLSGVHLSKAAELSYRGIHGQHFRGIINYDVDKPILAVSAMIPGAFLTRFAEFGLGYRLWNSFPYLREPCVHFADENKSFNHVIQR